MIRTTLFALALVGTLGATRAEAQTSSACPPGQPCVVVVPQQQPQPQPQIVVPQQPPTGYVTVQPIAPQQPVVYGAAAPPQRQMVEVTRTRLRWGLVIPGMVGILVGWVGNWTTAILGTIPVAGYDEEPYFASSFLPIVGPWINTAFFGDDSGFFTMHIIWGVLQGAGLLLCILGTALQEEIVEMQYALGDGVELAVLPYADQNGGGLQAGLSF